MRVVIMADGDVGYEKLCDAIVSSGISSKITSVITGLGRSVDGLVQRWCSERQIPITMVEVTNRLRGSYVGHNRNVKMAKMGDILIAITDGKGKTMNHLIDLFLDRKKMVHMFVVDGENETH